VRSTADFACVACKIWVESLHIKTRAIHYPLWGQVVQKLYTPFSHINPALIHEKSRVAFSFGNPAT
jgi:hypothetical protein